MLAICCSCGFLRLKFHPIILFLSLHCLWVSLEIPSYVEYEPYSSFLCYPSSSYKSPVSVVVRCGGEEAFHSSGVRSQPCSEPVPLGCDLHKRFSALFSPVVRHKDWMGLELHMALPSHWLGSGKTLFLEDRTLLRERRYAGSISKWFPHLPLLEAQGSFSALFILKV